MGIQIGKKTYTNRVKSGIEDPFMRQAVSSAQERLKDGRIQSEKGLGNWEDWRSLGEEIRRHTLDNLDYYLEQLSEQVEKRGGNVFFARTADEANHYINRIIQEKNGKKVVKAKSMVTEEIGLNDVLEKEGVEVVETDLGEWILQLDDDPPSHIVAPALHKDRERIREVFADKKGYLGTNHPEELTQFAREQLRKEFLSADIGITGCNFAVAESGTITLVTNEGNGRLTTSLPDTHIAVMGMERIVPTWEELDILVSLLTRAAVGQKLTSYITSITGTRLKGEIDGPSEFHLVIVDNGRSNILGTEFQSALHCIRCAACINVCPVYRHIGGHAYGSIYPGPIGAVITPLLDGYEDHHELPYASSLCAACTEACPVKIPLHELLIRHREIIVEKEDQAPISEKIIMNSFAKWASTPAAYKLSTKIARPLLKPWSKEEKVTNGPGPLKGWTDSRDFPTPSKQSFRSWYKTRQKGSD
ncbi:LutB/LldF family L-lactate oxidation iron-sulfur protein [Pseudogracilibacillus auburnensis]|uniref:LutB/LldF family L-lactate oxidation iron-sulfur protein n=1 Tax=Pseudogracilibacillus auburnensis TaxID=1494959 RepID=UPI001A968225|nr:LutB/LldF family L-lactate oxidation iron-sulfur protein [Pseudogracilibacillus auburnensis]MBO1002314.1 iron-sulfur cluster-binding protein [Pseudogracilibacillus auburnensis]